MPRISASLRSAGSIVGRGRIRSPRAANALAGAGGGATVPSAPSAFAQSGLAQTIGSGPVVISWTAPANGGAAITSYTLTYKWIQDGAGGTQDVTLHTRTSSATSYTIEEASPNGVFSPDSGSIGAQPRWSFGGNGFRVIVAATNSVGTGATGLFDFGTGGGD
jgi:hypothetical protein